ncbi:RsiW-degrading membrane proteinase PrsW (M82 family) [Stackebrandtia albiflava]|uniref:RsiW-degrading membrane proteinase PrsW (M82 family) n=1 Tax=Stackebrandtia albiflava TaxID=406432 RepID=A0A562V1S0_9ACTN|nr:PrsW family intramembrane metalloprotease [Stackebrandtia albiflava]TWJ11828.1 RsiW-degrading membrane proteinase PrsW (M82 family) [Stackebrandtia albiflava]
MMLLAVYLPPTVGALTLAWVIKFSVSPSGIAIGVAAAVLPVPLLVGCVLWLGRYNHRPVRYLIFCFAWGALVATGVSVLVNTSVSVALEQVDWAFLDHIDRPSEDVMPWPDFFAAIASAPVIEELTKALAPFAIFLFRRRHFTGVLDGIVYCGLAGIGFAMVENILYLGRGFDQGDEFFGIGGGVLITGMTFVMRILFSGFAHPLFSSMIGIGLGMSRRRRPGPGRLLIPLGMVVAAMLLHSAWNLIASLGPAILLSGYMAVMVPIFFTVVGVALWLRAADARLAVTALSDLVDAGLLSPPEIAALATHRRRGAARLWARRVAGDAGFKAMREYQRLATQLSATRDAVARGFTPPDPETERQLLQRLLTYREVFTGADPAMPRATWDGRYYQVQFPDGSIRQINPPVQPIMPIPIMPPGVPRPVPPVPAWRPAS